MGSELVFNFSNLTEKSVGDNGISDRLIDSLSGKAHDIHADLNERRKKGKLPFMDLPYTDVDDIIRYTDDVKNRFENFVNVGIGGSSLGAQALVMALCHPFHNLLKSGKSHGLRMFFADNIDPDYLSGIFEINEPSKTIFNIITKSGSTAETMGTFLLVMNVLKKTVGVKWRNHIVVTTDPVKGDLRKITEQEKLTSFSIPPGVGGRFSVFCPVGLLPASCAGIDIKDLLYGAAEMDRRLQSSNVMDNPSYLYSLYQYLLNREKGKHISVMMPYSSGLYGLADWYRQIWAESLGKRFDLNGREVYVGPTPVKALGVTDQHSQVQLYVEGPRDKVFTFLEVDSFKNTLLMDSFYPGLSSLDYLGGHSMAELMKAEMLGTLYAFTCNKRPNMTITFPEVTPHSIGQFMYAFEVSTVFSGGLYNINPLDQPGVEHGKIAAFALMGRKGYQDKAEEIKKWIQATKPV